MVKIKNLQLMKIKNANKLEYMSIQKLGLQKKIYIF